MRTRAHGFLRTVGLLVLSFFVVAFGTLMLFENYLVYPAPRFPQGDWSPDGISYEEIDFSSTDGVKLHGWYFDHPAPRAHLLYCHGNGEHVAYLADYLDWLREELQVSIFAFDYRGYGKSAGSPHEAGVLQDGEAALQWLAERTGCEREEIVLMGRSLGGAVAIDLASRFDSETLIVESTFTSMPEVAARIYWWAPVKWLMSNRFESQEKIASFRGKLLIGHGAADRLVPAEHAVQLLAACPSSRKRLLVFPDLGHNDPSPPEFYAELRALLLETQ